MLTLLDKAFALKKTSLFQALDLDLLLTIADKMELAAYEPKAAIFSEGQEATHMYFILSGRIEIQKGGERLAELGACEFFGDESLFNEKERGYSAICKSKVSLLTLTQSHLFTIIEECPSVAIALLEAYAQGTDFRHK